MSIIKSLDWQDPSKINNNCFIAKTIIGDYVVANDDGWHAALWDGPIHWEWKPENDPRSYSSEYEHKEACEKHFQSMITATLEEYKVQPLALITELTEFAQLTKKFTDEVFCKIDFGKIAMSASDIELMNKFFISQTNIINDIDNGFKVVATSNYDKEMYSEQLHTENLTKAKAVKLAKELNDTTGKYSEDYYAVKPYGYQLKFFQP